MSDSDNSSEIKAFTRWPTSLSHRSTRGFAGIMTGTALAQLLTIASVPVLARLYSPENTSRFALLLGVASTLSSFTSLRLEAAIPLPDDDREAREIFGLTITIPILITVPASILVSFLVATQMWTPYDLSIWDILLIAVLLLVLSWFGAASQYAIRNQSYSLLARIPIFQVLGTLVAQISMGLLGIGRGLLLGSIAGRSIGIRRLVKTSSLTIRRPRVRSEASQTLKKFWKFPVLFAPAAVVNNLGQYIALLMLPHYFGLGATGLYVMATRITSLPASVIGDSAGKVFLGEYARGEGNQVRTRAFLRWSVTLLVLGTSLAALAWYLAPFVVSPILGETWVGTEELVRYTGVSAGAAVIGSPIQHVWTVHQEALTQFFWNLVRLGLLASAITIGHRRGYALDRVVLLTMWATCVSYGIAWLGCLWTVTRGNRIG